GVDGWGCGAGGGGASGVGCVCGSGGGGWVRPDGDDDVCYVFPDGRGGVGAGGGADRAADRQHAHVCAGCWSAVGAAGGAGGVVHWRGGGCPWVAGSAGFDGA